MVKIKREVKKNLPQLLEWLLKSGYRNYTANSNMGNTVTLSRYGAIQFSLGTFFPEDTFTVEVEECVTEDMKISKLAHYSIYGFKGTKNCTSINDVKDDNSIAFYIMNDDRTMTLIWTKEKGLVK